MGHCSMQLEEAISFMMIFKSMEILVHDKEIKLMQKDKLHWIAMAKCSTDARKILAKNKRNEDLLVRELDILLLWFQIPKSECSDKKKKLVKWMELKDKKHLFCSLDRYR